MQDVVEGIEPEQPDPVKEAATKVVWKFSADKLVMTGALSVKWPKDQKILCLRKQGGHPMLGWAFWCETLKVNTATFCENFDPAVNLEDRHFVMVGTGHADVIDDTMEYIDTIFSDELGTYVFHVYEINPPQYR